MALPDIRQSLFGNNKKYCYERKSQNTGLFHGKNFGPGN